MSFVRRDRIAVWSSLAFFEQLERELPIPTAVNVTAVPCCRKARRSLPSPAHSTATVVILDFRLAAILTLVGVRVMTLIILLIAIAFYII